MEILSAKSISKSYPDQPHAVEDTSFALHQGEVLAIIGRSGSGKTTLVKMIAGLLQPDSGEILFMGRPLKGPDEKLVPGHKEIRLVHQDFKLYHRMTVEENLRNALIEYVDEYIQSRTQELLALCRITAIRSQYVHEISGGEKQRLAIAMALSTEPEILLFDEPFSNLDFMNKSTLLREISSIAKATGTGVVLITHDSRDALEIGDRIMVMHKGRLIRTGTPREIYQTPRMTEVANLLGIYNTFESKELETLVPGLNTSSSRCGLWPEDITIGRGELTGLVKEVVFAGHLNRILIRPVDNPDLWAFDHTRQIRENDTVKFGISAEKLFALA